MTALRTSRVGARGSLIHNDRLPYYLALSAVALAVFSRLFVSWGVPSPVNFVHIPLALAAFATTRHPHTIRHQRTLFAIAAFALFGVFSGVVNGVEPARFLSAIVLWVEPVLVGYVVWVALDDVPDPTPRRRIGWLVLSFSIGAQFLLMTAQIPRQLSLPGGDQMQGTFLGSGTGAHVAPAVVLVGVVLVLDSVLRSRAQRWPRLLIAIYGLFLAQMALARAVIVVFVAALIIGAWLLGEVRSGRRTVAFVLTAVIGVGIWVTLPLVGNVPDLERQRPGWEYKLGGFMTLVEDMRLDVTYAVAGQGPGMTLSRVAMQTPDASLNSESPIASLGFETTDITREVLSAGSAVPIAESSLYSPSSTAVGLLGDVGAVGLTLYALMWIPLISSSVGDSGISHRLALTVIVIASAVLGSIQTWLEEPGYILPVALLIALSTGSQPSGRYPPIVRPPLWGDRRTEDG